VDPWVTERSARVSTAVVSTQKNELREQLRELARDFAERVVRPRMADLDRQPNPVDCMSWEIVEEASKCGLRTMSLAPEWGGPGVDTLTAAVVIEEVAKVDIGVAVILAQNNKFIYMLQQAGTDDQKARWLPIIAEDPRCLIATGLTEPERGSDYLIPYDSTDGFFKSNAVRTDGGWTLNGFKQFISNGNTSRIHFVFAQTVKEESFLRGSTVFIIEKGTPGFTIGRVHDKLGERLVNNAEWIIQDCFVPDQDVFGEPHKAFELLPRLMGPSNVLAAATVLGVGVGAYDKALAWTQMRVQGGKPLIEHDTIAVRLAEMRMNLDAARTYVHHAAVCADNRELGWDPVMTAYPKVVASKAAWDTVTKAMEMHGGYGYMKETGMEKYLRDAAAFLHSDGVNLTLLLKAAKFIRASL
jgi:alkylation response protein AidB-like acyl-CoA dehydrogenase